MRAIGIDIGGTKMSVACVDSLGTIHSQETLPTNASSGFEESLKQLTDAMGQTLLQSRCSLKELVGIGIGCTGPVDPVRGTIHNPFTLPTWEGCNIVEALQAIFSIPVRLENDADAAALGEYQFGAGQSVDPMAMITFGTGIGFSLIVKGEIYRGVDGVHPEFGHISVIPGGPRCYCGIQGCFESIASGSAIERVGKSHGFTSSRQVFQEATQGNVKAIDILEDVKAACGTAIRTVAHAFLPERIILGGGIIDEHFELFAEPMRHQLHQSILIPKEKIHICKARLGQSAGVIGAAWLVMRSNSSYCPSQN